MLGIWAKYWSNKFLSSGTQTKVYVITYNRLVSGPIIGLFIGWMGLYVGIWV
ncbi:hypothetical protein Hanom_Chr16g01418161 [Helianthus anomalus]